MSNWLQTFIDGNSGPVERTVRWGGQEQIGYFRRISAGERMQLVQGQKVTATNGQAEIEIDLGAQENTKHRMVFFACCKQDGSRLFDKVKDVAALDGSLVNALFKIAQDVNKDESEEDLGKG